MVLAAKHFGFASRETTTVRPSVVFALHSSCSASYDSVYIES